MYVFKDNFKTYFTWQNSNYPTSTHSGELRNIFSQRGEGPAVATYQNVQFYKPYVPRWHEQTEEIEIDLLVIAVEECEMKRDRKQGAMNATREACENGLGESMV